MKYKVAELSIILDKCRHADTVAIDTEWNPLTEAYEEDFHIHGLSVAVRDGKEILAAYLKEHDEIQQVLDVIADGKKRVVAHYSQAEHQSIQGSGFTLKKDLKYCCTAVAINVLDEDRQQNKTGLKYLAPEFLRWELNAFSGDDMESEDFTKYAVEDAVATLMLFELFEKPLKENDLYDVYELICASTQPFGDMSYSGMEYDVDVAEDQYAKFWTLRAGIEEQIYTLIGRLNLASSQQVGQRLFNELNYTAKNLEVSKETKKVSTGVKNMTKLASKYPVCELILAHRTCNKMIGSMLEPWSATVTSTEDSRLHPNYSFITATGRTKCSKPNVQQIPKSLGKGIKHNERLKAYFNDLKLREGFVAPEGYKFIICDYSSAEYHIAAIAAPDEGLRDLYCEWECPHCGTLGYNNKVVRNCEQCGKEVKQGRDLHQKNCDIATEAGANITRNQAKAVSFLAIFGGGAYRLSKDLNLPVHVCEQILNDVLDAFPGLRKWHERTTKIADTTGEVRDIFGRRRKINVKKLMRQARPDQRDWVRKNAINKLVNFVCQSPVSTICQIAAQNIRTYYAKEGLWLNEVQPAIMVHDSLGYYVKEELAENALNTILTKMETAVEIDVPMNAEGGIFDNFAE